jgi:hypothetical protein
VTPAPGCSQAKAGAADRSVGAVGRRSFLLTKMMYDRDMEASEAFERALEKRVEMFGKLPSLARLSFLDAAGIVRECNKDKRFAESRRLLGSDGRFLPFVYLGVQITIARHLKPGQFEFVQ